MIDMERIEVLEGPQGTLFGGGAEAGALRYITNKPKLDVTEGRAEGGYARRRHGDPNSSANAVLNVPLITGKLAVRGVFYSERRGGYIDNVPTRSPAIRTSIAARAPTAPRTPPSRTYYNYNLVERAQNPTTYQGLAWPGSTRSTTTGTSWSRRATSTWMQKACRCSSGESRSHTAATAPGKLVHAGVEPGQVQQHRLDRERQVRATSRPSTPART